MSRHRMAKNDADKQNQAPSADQQTSDVDGAKESKEKTGQKKKPEKQKIKKEKKIKDSGTMPQNGQLKHIAEELDVSLDKLNQLEQAWKTFRQNVIAREKNSRRFEKLKNDLKQVRRQLKRATGEQLEEAQERERVVKEELSELQNKPHQPKILDKSLRDWVMSSQSSWENFLSASGRKPSGGFFGKIKNWFSPSETEREKMWKKMYKAWQQGK